MSQPCIQVNMTNLKQLMSSISPKTILCIRGRHAVGKSECVEQFAQEMGLPLVMRRLSQMTEGDMLGLPVIPDGGKFISDEKGNAILDANGNKVSVGTGYTLCDWFLEGVARPVVLFLDERNRALDAVKQSIFEIADSRQIYGRKLHPGTYVVIAENVGDSYSVQACDPAEVSRTVTVQLEPTVEEWLSYAQTKCHPAVIEYIRGNPKALEFVPSNGQYEPNKKYPDRRSWMALNHELARPRNDKNECMIDNAGYLQLQIMCQGFIGTEFGVSFAKFLNEREKQVTAADILKSWERSKARLSNNGKMEITNESYIELVGKMEDFIGDEKKLSKMTKKDKENLCAFIVDLPAEPRMAFFSTIATNHATTLLRDVHHLGSMMAETITGEETRKAAAAAATPAKK